MTATAVPGQYPGGQQRAYREGQPEPHLFPGVTPVQPNAQSPQHADAPVRGQAGDLWADIVIGKPSFAEVSPFTTVPNKLFWAHGTIVDRTSTPNKLYVYDSGNNRILGFDLSTCLAHATNPLNCSVDLVIGQPDMYHSGCNGDSGYQNYPARAPATAASLCGQQESQLSITEGGSGSSMAIDGAGNLYVTDYFNHRVLKYASPFTTDTVADDVWGQDNFSDNNCNKGRSFPDATSLCFSWGSSNNWTASVDVDAEGNLWVVDSGNNRVLRFPAGSHTADLVLGQDSFDTRYAGSGLNQFWDPAAVRVSPSGRAYVADFKNDRVLAFDPPFSNGMSGSVFGSGFVRPSSIDFDPTRPGVWIMSTGQSVLQRLDETTQQVVQTIGNGDGNLLGDVTGSIGIDSAGDLFIPVARGNYQNDVLMFAPGGSGVEPTKQLFGDAPGLGNRGNQMTASGLRSGAGVVVAANQLIVSDDGRILFWNDPQSLYDGKPADGVTGGVSDFTTNGGLYVNMRADNANHLYVAATQMAASMDRIEIYQLPLVTAAQPIRTIQLPLPVLGGGQIDNTGEYEHFWGVAPSSDGQYLWVSHADTSRVFRIRDPLTNPVVDVILGQTDLSGTQCNRGGQPITGATLDTLCWPGAVALDRFGNLYVSDHSLEIRGNMRLLEFDASLFPTDNQQVIFATPATRVFSGPNATWQPAFDAQNRMVVGYNPYWQAPNGGWFPAVYADPLAPSATPTGFLKDYYSEAYSATFDDFGNLYVGDLDRSRVLIYKQPFGSVAPSPTGTPPRTDTPTPTLTNTPSPTDTFTSPPTSTPSPSDTPSQADTSSPTVTLSATNTPSPTSTSAPTDTLSPTDTPPPTDTAPLTNTPEATHTPLPSSTAPRTPTYTPTNTPDAVSHSRHFQDVSAGDVFYTYIECIATRNIIAGYPCGGTGEPCGPDGLPYYRPSSNISRGQLAKILSAGADLGGQSTPQIFEDVPPGSPFYDWVQQLAARGYISGYRCGGAGEPCVPPANRPYFRSGDNASRGQISKMIANILNLNGTPTVQRFADVPPSDPFYVYIERIAGWGIISGYPDGTFRPSYPATRGQVAKIVANAFFPHCQVASRP